MHLDNQITCSDSINDDQSNMNLEIIISLINQKTSYINQNINIYIKDIKLSTKHQYIFLPLCHIQNSIKVEKEKEKVQSQTKT